MRLQILELPVQHIGQVMHTPFVLVASEVDLDLTVTRDAFTEELRDQTGASAIFVTSDVVEIGPPPFEPPSLDIETAMRAYT